MATRLLTNYGVAFLRKLFAGGGNATGFPEFNLDTDHTAAANVSTGLTTLASYALPANTLQNNGDSLYIRAEFVATANANNKTYALTFGAATGSRGPSADSGLTVMIEAWVVRTSATTQLISFRVTTSGGNATNYTQVSGSETLTAGVTIAVKGQSGTGSGDITSRLLQVRYTPVGSYV